MTDDARVLEAIARLESNLEARYDAELKSLRSWRELLDGVAPGGLPARINGLEVIAIEQRGSVKALRLAALLSGLAVSLWTLMQMVGH